jgi:hypothetical protein
MIKVDDQPLIHLVPNRCGTITSRHIDIGYQFIRDKIEKNGY